MGKSCTGEQRITSQSIAFGFLIGIFLSSLAKLIGIARDYSLLFLFEAGTQTDALFASGAVTAVVWHGLTVGLGTAVLRTYVSLSKDDQQKASQLVSALFVFTFTIGVLAAGSIFFISDKLIDFMIPGSPFATRQEAIRFIKFMVSSFPLTGVAAIQSALLQAHGRKKTILVLPVLNGFCGLFGVFFAVIFHDLIFVIYGGLLGWVLQCVIQFFLLRPHWKYTYVSGIWPEFKNLVSTSLFITGTVYLNTAVVAGANFWISGTSDGNITYYSLASRITLACAGLASSVLTVYSYPDLIRLYDRGLYHQVNNLVVRSLAVAIAAAGGILVVILSLGVGLAGFLNDGSSNVISPVLVLTIACLVPNTFSVIIMEFWSRVCVVTGCMKENFFLTFVAALTSFVLSGVLLFYLGIYGVAAATSAVAFVSVAVACYLLAPRWNVPFPKYVTFLPLIVGSGLGIAVFSGVTLAKETGDTFLYQSIFVCITSALVVFCLFLFLSTKIDSKLKLFNFESQEKRKK